MAKGLLLGNGINACLGLNDLLVDCIEERFRNNVGIYSSIFENLFGIKINENFWDCINNKSRPLGIETLAGILYKYVKDNKKDVWTDNDEYRIQDVIMCICISSIFYTKYGKINQSFNETRMPLIDGYDYIFTLNYVEFWDTDHKCIHLHGKVDLSKLCNEKNAILISKNRMHLMEYSKSIKYINRTNNVIVFEPNDIIFAPEGIEKNNLISVTGIFPSNKLYPADDLFLYRGKELYTELDKVNELDIFVMSPYGDQSIIDKINSKNKVRVFIHKKNINEETKVWDKKLTCTHELIDSSEMQ